MMKNRANISTIAEQGAKYIKNLTVFYDKQFS